MSPESRDGLKPQCSPVGERRQSDRYPDHRSQIPGSQITDTRITEHRYPDHRTQIPGPQIPGSQNTDTRITNQRHQDHRYPDHRYPDHRSQIPGSKNTDTRITDHRSKTPGSQTPVSQIKDTRITDQRHQDHRYPDHRSQIPGSQIKDTRITDTRITDQRHQDHRYPDHRSKTPGSQISGSQINDTRITGLRSDTVRDTILTSKMGDFKSSSLWLKLAFLIIAFSFLLDLVALSMWGWASSDLTCADGRRYCGTSGALEFTEVVGFLCLITATVLLICLVYLDELAGNKAALIAFVVLALLGGLLVIIGVSVYNDKYTASNSYSTLVTVMCGLLALLAGVFGILELVGVSAGGK